MNHLSTTKQIENYNQIDFIKYLDEVIEAFQSSIVQPKEDIFYKAGKYTAKTVKFLRRTETKSAVLLGHWAAEAFVIAGAALALYFSGNYALMFLVLTLAAYGTYSLFSILSNQKI